ncbi:hypothetical protein AQUCO_14200016v1 [Aquilegia coerulea]|uniref:Ubiquitin carboxyl-terminal hydrolase n=1 Tax=Aquilegia coerulea TaxID=218851 RepID=A0A2G5C121_AQUCA|nr:hypothetical protein AQUCO_14200016v1 [Aquilegia coerulea]
MLGNKPVARTTTSAVEEEKVLNVDCTNAGLRNLGNSCYANSTLQCLYAIPELRVAIFEYAGSKVVDIKSRRLTTALKNLFDGLDDNQGVICPLEFLMALRNKYPSFGKMKDGMPMQQDALDCWISVINTLYQTLKGPDSGNQCMEELFGIGLVGRRQYEGSDEQDFIRVEPSPALRCVIPSVEIDLLDGLKQSYTSKTYDSSRGVDANVEYLITDLPRYFTINLNRFCVTTDSEQKVKIAQKVNYPLELNVYNLCSEDLRKKLEGYGQVCMDNAEKLGFNPSETSGSSDKDVKSGAELLSTKSVETSGAIFEEEQSTGIYDLVAVLTHKGSSANSGHYIAYVKQESGQWIQFDDDTVKPQQPEHITELSGGDLEHDIAYIIMYKARVK